MALFLTRSLYTAIPRRNHHTNIDGRCKLQPAGATKCPLAGSRLLFLSLGCRLGLCRRLFGGFLLRLRLVLGAFGGGGLGLRFGLRLRTLGRLGALGQDFRDADQHEILPVTALAPRVLAAALLEGDDLRTPAVADDLGRDARALDHRRAEFRLVAAQHDDVAELHDRARLALNALDLEDLILGDPVLLAAGFDDCEHRFFPRSTPALGLSGPAFSSRFMLWLQALSAVTIRAGQTARANGRTYGGRGQNCQESRQFRLGRAAAGPRPFRDARSGEPEIQKDRNTQPRRTRGCRMCR